MQRKSQSAALFWATVKADHQLHMLAETLKASGIKDAHDQFDLLRGWLADQREGIQDNVYDGLENTVSLNARAG